MTLGNIILRRTYRMPWRPAYEAIAVVGWGISFAAMFYVALSMKSPLAPLWRMALISSLFLLWALRDCVSLWMYKVSLAGKAFAYVRTATVLAYMKAKPGRLWLGYGFDWTPTHTARVLELRKRDPKDLMPPTWFLKVLGLEPQDEETIGKPWIHGVEPIEKNIFVPIKTLEGGTIVWGTTGAGKTRLYENLIYQAVMRGDVVIFIDPKGDADAREVVRQACIKAGRPDAFLFFHPAFPAESVRIDPLANWNRITSIASRTVAPLATDGGSDSFIQFAWSAINKVAMALVYIEERPNLVRIRRYIENGAQVLMERTLRTYLVRRVPNWEARIAPYQQRAAANRSSLKIAGASRELLAYADFYATEVEDSEREQAVDGLMAMVTHDQAHFSKMIQNVLPLLASLTSGDLAKLLSPDASDINDPRPIVDSDKIIRQRKVFYLGLDSLSDATVSGAIASILLADLAAVAGDIYNYATNSSAPEHQISLYIDEAAEAVNMPLIQIMNKGRGAGFNVTLAAQTYPDFIAKMGRKEKADMILGNCNNMIALRTKDTSTQEWIARRLGETDVDRVNRSVGNSATSEDGGIVVRSSQGTSFSTQETAVFPTALLGMLPNLHYILQDAGGRMVKGRLAKIT